MLSELTIGQFIERLGSGEATPGGGGAAALTGACAAGLLTMVAHLTAGRPAFAAIESQVQAIISEGEQLQAELVGAIEADAQAFQAVMAAYALPRTTADHKTARQLALQPALIGATESPLRIARACGRVSQLAVVLAEAGNPQTITDTGTAASLAFAALQGAIFQARINLKAIKDRQYAAARETEIEQLITASVADRDRTFAAVEQKLA